MEFSFSPSVVSQDSEGGDVSRGKQTDKLSLQQGKEKGEKTEYKLEEGKLSSTTPLESQVHERLSLLLALEEEEEGMLVDREGGEDVIGSENYFEGKVLILFLPPFHSRNKKTEEGGRQKKYVVAARISRVLKGGRGYRPGREQEHTLFNDLRQKLAKRSKELVNLNDFLLSSKKNYKI